MKKSWIEMVQDYVDVRLAIGGCLLNVLLVALFIWAMVTTTIEFVTDWIEGAQLVGWIFWVAFGLFMLTVVIAVMIGVRPIRHRSRIGGIIMSTGAVLQLGLFLLKLSMMELHADWLDQIEDWFVLIFQAVFVVGLIVLSIKAFKTDD
jgi:hypothetical protein